MRPKSTVLHIPGRFTPPGGGGGGGPPSCFPVLEGAAGGGGGAEFIAGGAVAQDGAEEEEDNLRTSSITSPNPNAVFHVHDTYPNEIARDLRSIS